MILVIDINKGIQVQTAECIALGELLKLDILVVLNKIDLISEKNRWIKIKKTSSALKKMLKNSNFRNKNNVPVLAYSTKIEKNLEESVDIMNLALMSELKRKEISLLNPQKHLKQNFIETILKHSLLSFRFSEKLKGNMSKYK